jgi:hypothetical protein
VDVGQYLAPTGVISAHDAATLSAVVLAVHEALERLQQDGKLVLVKYNQGTVIYVQNTEQQSRHACMYVDSPGCTHNS